jgi:hypothetical protein
LNSWDDAHEDLYCDDEVSRVVFIQVGDYGETSETLRFRCRTRHMSRALIVHGHFGILRHDIEFQFTVEIICKCEWPP